MSLAAVPRVLAVAAVAGSLGTGVASAFTSRGLESRFAQQHLELVDLHVYQPGDSAGPILHSYLVPSAPTGKPVAFVVLYRTSAAAVKDRRGYRVDNVVVTFTQQASAAARRAVRAALGRR